MADTAAKIEELETEKRGLIQTLEQDDNDALEAIDQLIVALAAGKVSSIISTLIDLGKEFVEKCQNRIDIRAKVREVQAEIDKLQANSASEEVQVAEPQTADVTAENEGE